MERVLLAAALGLPVPVLAASGLAVPLPAIVERAAAALVPFADGPPLAADIILGRAARPGSIVSAPGEEPYVAGAPDSVPPGISEGAGDPSVRGAAAQRAANAGSGAPSSAVSGQASSPTSEPQGDSGSPTTSEPAPQGSDTPAGGSNDTPSGGSNDRDQAPTDDRPDPPKTGPTPSPSPQPTPQPKEEPNPRPSPEVEPADTPDTGATDTAAAPTAEPTTDHAPLQPTRPEKGGQSTDLGPPVEVADPAKDDVPDGGAPGQESGERGRPAQSDQAPGPPPR